MVGGAGTLFLLLLARIALALTCWRHGNSKGGSSYGHRCSNGLRCGVDDGDIVATPVWDVGAAATGRSFLKATEKKETRQ